MHLKAVLSLTPSLFTFSLVTADRRSAFLTEKQQWFRAAHTRSKLFLEMPRLNQHDSH